MNDLVKGICRLGLVPMRNKPSHDAVLTSELLFGEHYSIVSSNKGWYNIQLAFDNSSGWIHQSQHFSITDSYFEQINLSDYKVCTDISGTIFFQKKYVNILLGSILPIASNELFKLEEQVACNGASKSLSQLRDFEFMKETIAKYHHAPYRKGGKSPFGIDEGGFIQQVYKICGYKLPRHLDDQLKAGRKVETMQEIELGDVVIIGGEKPKSGFIYLGNEQYIGVIGGQVEKITDLKVDSEKLTIRRILHKKSVRLTG